MKSKAKLVYRFNIINVNVSITSLLDIVQVTAGWLRTNRKAYITVTGVHGIIESYFDEKVRKAHNEACMSVPDGMPLVWIGKLKGHKEIERCYGPDLMLAVMKDSVEKGYKHFFYGGAEGVAQQLKAVMEEKYPGVNIAGTYTPPFRPLNDYEEKELKNIVSELKPDIFWVGLSTPKQELFMHEYINKIDAKLMIGVGAAFDFHTGRVKQAPKWIQKIVMEWFFRLCMEPRRLWKRYLRNNPLFIILVIMQFLGLKKFNTAYK